jgi:hypothetical protein
MRVAARRALKELPAKLRTRINFEFDSDPADAVFKVLVE